MFLPAFNFRHKALKSLVLIALVPGLTSCDFYVQDSSCLDYFEVGDVSGYELLEGGLARHLQSQTVWYRCPAGTSYSQGTCQGTTLSVTWDAANAFAVEFGEKSAYRWQLPSNADMNSIMQTCRNPAVNPNVFPMLAVDNYWTSDGNLLSHDRKCISYTYQGQISCRESADAEHPFLLLLQP